MPSGAKHYTTRPMGSLTGRSHLKARDGEMRMEIEDEDEDEDQDEDEDGDGD